MIAHVESLPLCTAWLPDGRLLIVSSPDGRLLRREPDGALVTHAELGTSGWNDIVVDGRGNAYVNRAGFNPMAGEEFAPGFVHLVTPGGSVRQVADDVAFPNGMAVTPDNATLVVADSYRHQLVAFDIAADGGLSDRRVWADLGAGTPDGICLDAEGAVWYADVPNQWCARVAEGGAVLQTVRLDRGGFACALGGVDRTTLFMRGRRVARHDRVCTGLTRHRSGARHPGRGSGSRLAVTSVPPITWRARRAPGDQRRRRRGRRPRCARRLGRARR